MNICLWPNQRFVASLWSLQVFFLVFIGVQLRQDVLEANGKGTSSLISVVLPDRPPWPPVVIWRRLCELATWSSAVSAVAASSRIDAA